MPENERSRPAADRTAPESLASAIVSRWEAPRPARRTWTPNKRHASALDRHIAHVYGPEYVKGWTA